MKYPMTSLYLGQLILNQPITEELFDAFYEEYHGDDKSLKELVHQDNNGTFVEFHLLDELAGAISINDIEVRKFCVGEIENSIKWLYNDVEKVLESDEDEKLMPGEVTKLTVREVKDGKTFFDIEMPESVRKFHGIDNK
jgi:hypothetical protein